MESVWGDMQDRGTGELEKTEDTAHIVASVVIDGVKYRFKDDFMGMGDEYTEDNREDWRAFAFNKMPNGSTIISGDTDAAGAFGVDNWDIGYDDYDVYVLKDYMNMTSDELAQRAIDYFWDDCGQMYRVGDVHNIIEKYIKDVFVNHMSDYARFWITEVSKRDIIDERFVINLCDDIDIAEMDVVKEEFEGREIEYAHIYLYPTLDGWQESFEKELMEEYEKEGWTKSETFDVDYDVVPGKTTSLCFVQFEDEEDI